MVGEFSTKELAPIAHLLEVTLGKGETASQLANLFKRAYIEHSSLADATRFLVNELFAPYGLVIIDGNDVALKELLVPYFKQELIENLAQKEVEKTLKYIKKY